MILCLSIMHRLKDIMGYRYSKIPEQKPSCLGLDVDGMADTLRNKLFSDSCVFECYGNENLFYVCDSVIEEYVGKREVYTVPGKMSMTIYEFHVYGDMIHVMRGCNDVSCSCNGCNISPNSVLVSVDEIASSPNALHLRVINTISDQSEDFTSKTFIVEESGCQLAIVLKDGYIKIDPIVK